MRICKLISVQGRLEGLWRNRRLHHSHQFPNYVCSLREDTHPLINERRLLYSFPSSKTSGAETFAPRQSGFLIAPNTERLQQHALGRRLGIIPPGTLVRGTAGNRLGCHLDAARGGTAHRDLLRIEHLLMYLLSLGRLELHIELFGTSGGEVQHL